MKQQYLDWDKTHPKTTTRMPGVIPGCWPGDISTHWNLGGASYSIYPPRQVLAYRPKVSNNLVKLVDDEIFIRSTTSAEWRELEQAKRDLQNKQS